MNQIETAIETVTISLTVETSDYWSSTPYIEIYIKVFPILIRKSRVGRSAFEECFRVQMAR